MTTENPYENEFIIFDACKQYGVEFDEVMSASDRGEIDRREHLNSRGSTVYTFRRGDIVDYCNRRADDGRNS